MSRRIGRVVVATVAAMTLGARCPVAAVTISGGTPEHREMARWAVGRFETAGLTLPSIEIRFHDGREGCRGRLGYYADGVASLCRLHTDLMAGRNLLHEMAHGWLEENVTGVERDRFLELRGLTSWNDKGVEWEERGFEQAAEIMAWALGDQSEGILMPSIPENAPHQLAVAYELLTGRHIPELLPWMTWRGSGMLVSADL